MVKQGGLDILCSVRKQEGNPRPLEEWSRKEKSGYKNRGEKNEKIF